VIVTDDLPVGMLYNGSNNDFTVDFGTINTGETVTQTINVTIDAAFTGTTLINYAEITSDDGDDYDSTTNNQSSDEDDDDTAVVMVTQPQLVSLAGIVYHDFGDENGDDQYGSGDLGVG
jgi:hypothetical protein